TVSPVTNITTTSSPPPRTTTTFSTSSTSPFTGLTATFTSSPSAVSTHTPSAEVSASHPPTIPPSGAPDLSRPAGPPSPPPTTPPVVQPERLPTVRVTEAPPTSVTSTTSSVSPTTPRTSGAPFAITALFWFTSSTQPTDSLFTTTQLRSPSAGTSEEPAPTSRSPAKETREMSTRPSSVTPATTSTASTGVSDSVATGRTTVTSTVTGTTKTVDTSTTITATPAALPSTASTTSSRLPTSPSIETTTISGETTKLVAPVSVSEAASVPSTAVLHTAPPQPATPAESATPATLPVAPTTTSVPTAATTDWRTATTKEVTTQTTSQIPGVASTTPAAPPLNATDTTPALVPTSTSSAAPTRTERTTQTSASTAGLEETVSTATTAPASPPETTTGAALPKTDTSTRSVTTLPPSEPPHVATTSTPVHTPTAATSPRLSPQTSVLVTSTTGPSRPPVSSTPVTTSGTPGDTAAATTTSPAGVSSRCSMFPDLNVITFDGNSVAVYKAASYVLAKLPSETVTVLVQECPADAQSPLLWNFTNLCLAALDITHKSNRVTINRLQRRLYVNSRYAKPRFRKFGFEVFDTGNMYLIRTPAGLKLQWFHSTGMLVMETDSSSNKLATLGLCGICDGDARNDLTLASGTALGEGEDPSLFIDSWQVPNTTSYVSQSRRRELNCSTSDCSVCFDMLEPAAFWPCHAFVRSKSCSWPAEGSSSGRWSCWVTSVSRSHRARSATSGSEMKSMSTTSAWRLQPTPLPATNSMSASSGGGRTTVPAPTAPAFLARTARFGKPRRTAAACTDVTTTPSSPWSTTAPARRRPSATGRERRSSAWLTTPAAARRKSACVTRACATSCLRPVSTGRNGCRTTGRTPAVPTTCVCSPDLCETDVPSCRDDQTLIAARAEGSCCLAHICICSACPEAPPVCLQGEVLTVDPNTTDRCCPSYQCACDPHRCPQLTCPVGMSLESVPTPGRCCPNQTCECSCDKIASPKCGLGEAAQLDRNFLSDPQNQCACKRYKCVREAVCVFGERGVLRPGQTLVEHDDSGLCHSRQCSRSLDPASGFYLLRTSTINCSAHCQPNQIYIPPKDQSTCCGVCKNISCLYEHENGTAVLYKPGRSWVSNCRKFDCTDTLWGPTLISYALSCPPFNETECTKVGGTVVSYMDGCCKTCKEDGKSCQKVTVRMTIRKNDCRSNRPVNIVSCDGKCPSASIYNYNINTYARFCKCCRETGLQRRSVQLYCSSNSTWVGYSIQEPTDCSCQWS
ncbi:unnamed protein product, partial [Tetraodon nigroviridis]